MSDLERLYTLAEACEALQITEADVSRPERWLRDQVRRLKLPFYKVGRTVKLGQEALDAIHRDMRRADAPPRAASDTLVGRSTGQSQLTRDLIERLEAKSADRKARRRAR